MAFGEMGMSPSDFYEMEMEDFVLKVEGFLNHKDWLEGSLRRIAAIIQSGIPYKNPPKSMMEQWPMRKDAENRKKAKERTNKRNSDTKSFWERNLKTIETYNKRLK